MSDNIQFVPPPPVPVNVPLPGLVNGNILAMKDDAVSISVRYNPLLAVCRATVLNGDITYYGDSLFSFDQDQTVSWRLYTGILASQNVTRLFGQLSRVPDPPYLRQVRLQPYADRGPEAFLEQNGLLVLGGGWDPTNRFWITFRGDWCPLFRKQF